MSGRVLALDPAIVKALALDPARTSIAAHGGSGFASTFKLVSRVEAGTDGQEDRTERDYFVKMVEGRGGEVMLAGEHMSLNAIHEVVPSLCPKSYANGRLENRSGSFLATDFLNLGSLSSSGSKKKGTGLSLAEKLVKLHSTPAPIPDGFDKPMFGFPVPTCCGKSEQNNSFKSNWADFYAENRLRWILKDGEKHQGKDSELSNLVEQVASKVVPRLLGDDHLKASGGGQIVPVVVHGDLWSGNHGQGTMLNEAMEEVVFDPSSCYAHSEFEFGIMKMFGGFGASFDKKYHNLKPKDEPVGEWEDRLNLYELYHHLNHHAMFGGGYRGGAVRIMRGLIKKYGEGGGD